MARVRHGHAKGQHSPTYVVWKSMVQRTTNPNRKDFQDTYKDVSITADWLGPGGFAKFLAAVGPRPSTKYTLDRINPKEGYLPGNVRWVTKRVQAQNRNWRELVRPSTGEAHCVAEWAHRCDVRPTTIRKRLARGWSLERTVTTKKRS